MKLLQVKKIIPIIIQLTTLCLVAICLTIIWRQQKEIKILKASISYIESEVSDLDTKLDDVSTKVDDIDDNTDNR